MVKVQRTLKEKDSKKQNKTTRLTLVMDVDIIKRLKSEAAKSGVSVSNLTERYIDTCLPTYVIVKLQESTMQRQQEQQKRFNELASQAKAARRKVE